MRWQTSRASSDACSGGSSATGTAAALAFGLDKRVRVRADAHRSAAQQLGNLLAYDREQTDIDEVYGHMQTRLDDLAAFADQIDVYLGDGTAA